MTGGLHLLAVIIEFTEPGPVVSSASAGAY